MPEYVYVISLVLGAVFVCCQVISTVVAYRTCKCTCKMINLQLEEMKKAEDNRF